MTACEACKDGVTAPFDFTMAFQPIFDIRAQRVWCHEALVRGTDGAGAGSVLSKVTPENRYAFDQSCRVKAIELASDLFPKADRPMLSINFMPNAIYQPAACIRTTVDAAKRCDFPLGKIMFEFTEHENIDDVSHLKNIIQYYQTRGLSTAIDDFGAGYAGLGLLAEFQPDYLKIDMKLIRSIERDHSKQVVLEGILTIVSGLQITAIAEGIETKDEYEYLKARGINLMQGYYLAKPEFEGVVDRPVNGFD